MSFRERLGPFQSSIKRIKFIFRSDFKPSLKIFDMFFSMTLVLISFLSKIKFTSLSLFIVLDKPKALILPLLSHEFIELFDLIFSAFEFILEFGEISLES